MAEGNKAPETSKTPEVNKAPEANQTDTGLQENIAGLLCYVLGWISGIIFLIIEKQNKFVRFHAVQSIVVFGAYTIISIAFGWIPIFGWILNTILGIAAFIIWIVLMHKAYKGVKYKVPMAGDIIETYMGR